MKWAKQFKDMVNVKKQELKGWNNSGERDVGRKDVPGDKKDILSKYDRYIHFKGELNEIIEVERRKKKGSVRQQVMRNGKNFDDRFQRYKRSMGKWGKVSKMEGG